MQRETRGKRLQSLTQQKPAAMEPRLQRLILDLQSSTRLFRGKPLEITKDHGLTIDLRQLLDGDLYCPPQFEAQQFLVGHL